MRNNVVANWTGGYGTLLNYGSWANVVNNSYFGSHHALSLLSARGYVAGNLSADGANLNTVGTEGSPFPSASVTTQSACTAAQLVLAGAGARPLDSVDQQFLARIPALSCSGSSSAASLQVSSTSLAFDGTVGGLDPAPQPLSITNGGSGSLAWTATTVTGGAWLSVGPAAGTAPSTATVTTDPGGLSQGIYQGSIVITAPGATNSPRTIQVTLVVESAPSDQGIVQADIGEGQNDAREFSTGVVRTNEGYLSLGQGNGVALRFNDVDVPRGAVIQSAVVELYGVGALTTSVAIRYAAEDVGNSAPFTTGNRSLSSRPRTQASVDDAPGSWVTGDFNSSPDLRAIVQEVVERSDWRPGNSLTVFIDDSDSDGVRRVGSFETSRSPSRAARLTVIYEVP
jgi:hypothetical protein